jgi:hypothetical protein
VVKSVARSAILAALFALMVPATTQAASTPVVLELFTSQGCSSCPPANANLAALSARPDVLALSFGVTYWDYLGWKDTFAQPMFTERQKTYERALGHDGPFTPQIVVNGGADVVGADRGEIEQLIAKQGAARGPSILLNGDVVSVAAMPNANRKADVWLVRYDPRVIQVPISRGENSGVTLPHKNVVRSLINLGLWNGTAASFQIPPAPDGLSTAILVQAINGGPILSALKV